VPGCVLPWSFGLEKAAGLAVVTMRE